MRVLQYRQSLPVPRFAKRQLLLSAILLIGFMDLIAWLGYPPL